jgi:crotonobetainyl-CoA:carnitine CoA-transferase CaiB-like acyl-CoA transferase
VSAAGPLAGVRVLDLTRLLPGAFATALLADLGAEVIKVEQPGQGDYMRWEQPRIGAESAYSWVADRNKRSLVLDLKDDGARAAFERLVPGADIVFESFRPGVVDRLGIGYERLAELNPALVYCSLSGYGQDGPLAAAAGHDINYIGRAGLLSITGHAGERPALPGVQIGDLGGGSLMSCVGILAALHHARATGEGDHVDVSITDGAFAWLSIHAGAYFADGKVPGPEGMLLNGSLPAYNTYECADGRYLAVGALEPQFFKVLCERVGRPDLEGDRLDPEAVERWREIFRARSRDEWLAVFDGTDACVGPVNDLAEAVADPQLRARRMVVEQEHPEAGPTRQLGTPIKLRRHPPADPTAAPRMGESTRALLDAAGCSAAEIDALIERGAAAG